MPNQTTLTDVALRYHAFGANVLAIRDQSKAPIHDWTQWQDRVQNAAQVARFPWGAAGGIGIVAGVHGWRCFDFDHCENAAPVLTLLDRLGLQRDYPWVVRSGSGTGWHVWIICNQDIPEGALTRKEGDANIFIAPGRGFHHLELRWSKHQTVTPPSRHESGHTYGFIGGEVPETAPATVSAERVLSAFLSVTGTASQGEDFTVPVPEGVTFSQPSDPDRTRRWAQTAYDAELELVRNASSGDRNNQLNRSAFNLGQLVGAGVLDRSEVTQALTAAAQDAGLSGREVSQTIRSGLDRGTQLPRPIPEYSEHSRNSEPAPWGPPTPFGSYTLPDFPVDALPTWLSDFVQAEAEATQTPVDMAGMLALSVLGVACAKKVSVLVRPGYMEPVNVYTVTVLPPGSRKSAVFRACTRPLIAFEERQAASQAIAIQEAESHRRILEGRLSQLQGQASRAMDTEAIANIEELTRQVVRELHHHQTPRAPRLIVDDTTPERLIGLMLEHHGRMGVLSAEGDVFDIMAGRYGSSGSANFGVYLKAHAGDPIRVDRVGRPSEYIADPALTLGLTVQPEVIHGLADKPGFRGRGLLGRILYSLPVSTLGHRAVTTEPVSLYLAEQYAVNVGRLLELPWLTDEFGNETPHYLRLDGNALHLLDSLAEWLEPQLAEYGELGTMTDWAGKLIGAVARIAGLLHMALHAADPEPWNYLVNAATMDAAVKIGHYLTAHARAAFAEMGADPDVTDAKHILNVLARQEVRAFTKRDVFQWVKGRFKKVDAMEPALRVLVAHDFIREVPLPERRGPGRRPSQPYEVNPLWSPEVDTTVIQTVDPWDRYLATREAERATRLPILEEIVSHNSQNAQNGPSERRGESPLVEEAVSDETLERRAAIRAAAGEWSQARALAGRIVNPSLRRHVLQVLDEQEILDRDAR